MKIAYAFNYHNQNEYLTQWELPDNEPLEPWMTEVPYPETGQEHHCWCFNTETQSWDHEIEDYRGLRAYWKKDSRETVVKALPGPLPVDYILQEPPDFEQQYYYDDDTASWVLYQSPATELTFEEKKSLVKQRCWEQCKNYMNQYISDDILPTIRAAAESGGPKGIALQRWVQEFWYPFYYEHAAAIDQIEDETGLQEWSIDVAVYGEPPYSILEINKELYQRATAQQTLQALWVDQTMMSIPLNDDDTVRKVSSMADQWQAGQHYKQGKILWHENALYRVIQEVDALEHQTPGTEGMLAIYRPIDLDHGGTLEDPKPFTYGQDIQHGKYYSYEGVIYRALADMPACVYYPGSEGVWQWEIVEQAVEKLSDITL